MARPVVLSNSRLHVGINLYAEVHDFYYPYVGQENHAASKNMRHRIGVYVDGFVSWLDNGKWQFTYGYHENTLVGSIKAINESIGIALEFDDCVDAEQDVFIRNIHIINSWDNDREVKLFMHQVFDIGDSAGNGDTIQYLPQSQAILTYRGKRAFVIGGNHTSGKPFDQHSVGLFGIEGHEGTFADAEDGILANNSVEHGRVDSTIGFTFTITAHSSARAYYWIVVGTEVRDAIDRHDAIQNQNSALNRLLATSRWWHGWAAPAIHFSKKLDIEFQESFIQSILLIKSHIDHSGSVIASTDTTMLHQSRDAYAYCWPRDGAYAVWPLIRIGYKDEPLKFFEFCRRSLHPKGYLAHKYQSDGSVGASWHGYIHDDGVEAPPIQEDETAIVLFIFAQFYDIHKDNKLLREFLLRDFYDSLVKPTADFLSSYIDDTTGLPKPSYDLWEERFSTSTYTTSVVYAALLAAAALAEIASDDESAVRWRASADDILSNAQKHLYNQEKGIFYKSVKSKKGQIVKDNTVDSSAVFGAFMFGLYSFNSPEIQSGVEVMKNTLKMPQAEVLGLARYENDQYCRVSGDITGNPWFITALWLAQYYIEINRHDEAVDIIRWTKGHMMATGVLPEQINPYTGQYISVAPLTWSQAEYASALLDLASEGETGS
ncbi:MAG: glycoside hydrolase family 15 protein [Candidatus Saccharibacteria bacterium]|nr:glycoside hydrolase family 15 protein [Candidatus Saccharibacteria bacterium]